MRVSGIALEFIMRPRAFIFDLTTTNLEPEATTAYMMPTKPITELAMGRHLATALI
jgi:ABC-type arginine transport system ATPase subunit